MKKKYANILDEILDSGTEKTGSIGTGWPPQNQDTGEVEEGAEHVKEVAEAHGELEDNTGISRPETKTPKQIAAAKEDWNNKAAKAGNDDDVLAEALMSIEQAGSSADLSKKQMSDAEVASYINKLLSEGKTPKQAAEELDKLADLNLFNKQFGTEYLKNQAGVIGFAYLEPNSEYPTDCFQTKAALEKRGSIRAKSVKQIKACDGCQHFHQQGKEKSCGVYGLPIVGSAQELQAVIDGLVGNVPNKKAALVQIANKQTERVETTPALAVLSSEKQVIRTAGDKPVKKEASFGITDVEAMIKEGATLEQVFKSAKAKVGSGRATETVRAYVAHLKRTKGSVNLAQIDCTLLKNKLASENAIVGAEKCGSCTYRDGMHCGLTGGTLLSFPHMEKQASKHKIASGVKDGKQQMADLDLVVKPKMDDIELNEDGKGQEVDMPSSPKVNL